MKAFSPSAGKLLIPGSRPDQEMRKPPQKKPGETLRVLCLALALSGSVTPARHARAQASIESQGASGCLRAALAEPGTGQWPPSDWNSYLESIPTGPLRSDARFVIRTDPAPASLSFSEVAGIQTPEGTLEREAASFPEDHATEAPVQVAHSPYRTRTSLDDRLAGSWHSSVQPVDDRERQYSLWSLIPRTDLPWTTEVWPISLPDHRFESRFLVKTRILQEKTVVETYRTAVLPIENGIPLMLRKAGRGRELANIRLHDLKLDLSGPYPAIDSEGMARIREGRKAQLDALKEILAFVFPDYVSRRGWSEEFIRKLYHDSVARRLSTEYAVVRARPEPGGESEPMIATLEG